MIGVVLGTGRLKAFYIDPSVTIEPIIVLTFDFMSDKSHQLKKYQFLLCSHFIAEEM